MNFDFFLPRHLFDSVASISYNDKAYNNDNIIRIRLFHMFRKNISNGKKNSKVLLFHFRKKVNFSTVETEKSIFPSKNHITKKNSAITDFARL